MGKVVADWMTYGHAQGNFLEFEVTRFTSLHNNPRFLLQRTEEVVGRHYQLKYPIGKSSVSRFHHFFTILFPTLVDEFKTARGIRTPSIFSELEARGAVFGERMGWERPLYFKPHHGRDDPPEKVTR